MGVRIDTPPFAWRDEANDSYLGFLVDLCVDAVTRAGYPATQTPITPAAREAFFRGEGPDLDLLCDPTTISLARMRDFAALPEERGLEFTQIVFVANGAVLEQSAATAWDDSWQDGSLNVDGCVRPEPASDQEDPAGDVTPGSDPLPPGGDPAPKRFGAGFVRGTTGGEVLAAALRAGAVKVSAETCPVEFPTHWDAGRAFCEGHLSFYFGDQDILRSVIEIYRDGPRGCKFEGAIAPRPLSYEPYAFVVSGKTRGFRQAFVRALYEVFHHDTVTGRFHGNFEGQAMSRFLETLFRINQIPAGVPLSPDDQAPDAATVASGPNDAPSAAQ
ncbi:transporter substrate-binding domain-containing protein [Rubellimicrobium arenae]|uniref:transporter substrate-binding domain-containing protein n=1 Tax=Rubellimicrobium arenae TaxID=2817372 RepID=UPI001B3036FE|nr:transporter substrate-binding domain-containing protein [Rubellimicrobium arenae]